MNLWLKSGVIKVLISNKFNAVQRGKHKIYLEVKERASVRGSWTFASTLDFTLSPRENILYCGCFSYVIHNLERHEELVGIYG